MTCQLNESATYVFAKHGEEVGEEGKSKIEYWVPILQTARSVNIETKNGVCESFSVIKDL